MTIGYDGVWKQVAC